MKQILLGLAIFIAAGSAHAWSAKGVQGCGVYVDDFDKGGWEMIANAGWLAGALTGYNFAKKSNVGAGVHIQSIHLHVYNYCKENPLKDTSDALQDLILNLK